VFWVTMNALLWRAEYGAQYPSRSVVPVSVVWRKILTAPDRSPMNILFRGQRMGYFLWNTGVAEQFAQLEEAPSEGLLKKTKNYRIFFEGSIRLPETNRWLRFVCEVKLSSGQTWQEMNLLLRFRPNQVEVHADAAEERVRLKFNDGTTRFERVFRFDDLQDPVALLQEFGGPFSGGLLGDVFPGDLGMPAMMQKASLPKVEVKWDAHLDTLRLRHESVPVYRLQTRMLDRYPVVVYVSRVGEILRVELPGGLVIVHDLLFNNQEAGR
jgi:hypothetical protein